VLSTPDREWGGLSSHRDFPDLPLDSNVSVRALRIPVVGVRPRLNTVTSGPLAQARSTIADPTNQEPPRTSSRMPAILSLTPAPLTQTPASPYLLYQTALAQVFGCDAVTLPNMAGRTDRDSSTEFLTAHGIDAGEDNLKRFWQGMVDHLITRCHPGKGPGKARNHG
jgi:hypothetical protein